jgi:hypothetical protein
MRARRKPADPDLAEIARDDPVTGRYRDRTQRQGRRADARRTRPPHRLFGRSGLPPGARDRPAQLSDVAVLRLFAEALHRRSSA